MKDPAYSEHFEGRAPQRGIFSQPMGAVVQSPS